MIDLERARELIDDGRWARAAGLLKGAVPPVFRSERDFLLAEALRLQGFFRKARPLYESAARLALKENDKGLAVESLLGLVRVARSLGETKQAWPRLRSAWRLAGAEAADAVALEQALLDRAEERYAESLAALGKLLAKARARRDRAGEGYLLWATGGARRFQGDLAGARRDFQASLAAFGAAKDPEGQGYALFGLGGASRVAGELAQSLKHYSRAAALFRGTDDVFGQAYAHCGMANAQRQLGLWKQAWDNYQRSYALYRSLEDWVDLAYVDWGLGRLLMREGRLAAALKRFEGARRAFADFGETRGVVLADLSTAACLHSLGRTAKAEELHEAAVRRAREAGIHTHLELFT